MGDGGRTSRQRDSKSTGTRDTVLSKAELLGQTPVSLWAGGGTMGAGGAGHPHSQGLGKG